MILDKNQPLLTIIIPVFNGQRHIDNCLQSIINQSILEEGITSLYEIIIINDGSTDKTSLRAHQSARFWNKVAGKHFIRVIDKPNGQYGSVTNRGLKEARGLYFKVLDVDDTFHTKSFVKVLFTLFGLKEVVDIVLTDYTFEKVNSNKKILENFNFVFESNKILQLDSIKLPNNLITMHSIIYKTELLRSFNYKQIEKVYYSDSQYAIIPWIYAKTLYFIKTPLYRYFIGSEEQSINIKTMIKNRAHQKAVLAKIITSFDFSAIESKTMRRYIVYSARKMAQWQLMIMISDKSIKNLRRQMLDFIAWIKTTSPENYKKVNNNTAFNVIRLTRGVFSKTIVSIGFRIYTFFKKNIMDDYSSPQSGL